MGASASYISLLDRDRQWFKSTVGMGDVSETPRDGTFCDYAIRRSRPTVVLDATRDPLFSRSPYVTDGPKVRFYTGFPLWVDGQKVGTLCVLDFQARDGVEAEQLEEFQELALQAQEELARDPSLASNLADCVASVAFLVCRIEDLLDRTTGLEPSFAVSLVARYLELFRASVERWGGLVKSTEGVDFQAYFQDDPEPYESATRAAGCAIDLIRSAEALEVELEPEGPLVPGLAIALHQSPSLTVENLVFGWGAQTALRISECADAGQILASQQIVELLGPAALVGGELRVRLPNLPTSVLYELHGVGDFSIDAIANEEVES